MSDPIYITTPPGRLLQGDAFKPRTTDQLGNPLTNRDGTPRVQYFIGLGVPKGPEFDALWAQIQAKAALDFPGREYLQPTFKWKIEDGDDAKYAGREGFAGHWIWRMQTNRPPEVVDAQAVPQAVGPEGCQKGFYIRVQLSVKGNDLAGGANAGLYMNPNKIQVIGFGPVISSGPDAATVFAQPYVLPAGASATPLAPAAPLAAPVQYPAMPGAVAAPGMPGAAPAPGVPVAAPGMPGMPGAAPAPGVPVAAPGMPGAVAAMPGFMQTPGAQ